MKNIKFTKSDEFYKKVLKLIPTASQTFSKSAIQYSKGASPLFLDKGKGAFVWDVDGNKYIDYVGALLPIILGYNDKDVDNAIIKQLKKGISFSLPTTLELDLAKLIVNHIPCAEMVRFAKNGSDSTSAAIRLARAYTGKDVIAVSGYHGWHDWYIGTTSRSLGVPKKVAQFTQSFEFNNIESFKKLLSNNKNNVAGVMIEPESGVPANKNFLKELRDITQKKNIVLIFDEIVTGFRVHFSGAQAKYKIRPDLACFGKSLANGMPLSVITGKKKIMQLMDDIFFSGTFNGEALSIAAGIATLKKLKNLDVTNEIIKHGKFLKKEIRILIRKYKLEEFIQISGEDWRPYFIVKNMDILVTTLFRQTCVKYGILICSGFNLSYSHLKPEVKKKFQNSFEKIFHEMNKILNSSNPKKYLKGELIKPIFEVRKTRPKKNEK